MLQPKKRLADLVQKIEALGDEIRLNALADILRSSGVTLDDVSNYVHDNPRNYHRALVAKTEHFDLLILTWLPGQGSPPHDHSGSVSSMMVLQGTAAEGSWRIAADGYAELEYETLLQPGQLTAMARCRVHTVRKSISGRRSIGDFACLFASARRIPPLCESTGWAATSNARYRSATSGSRGGRWVQWSHDECSTIAAKPKRLACRSRSC